MGILDDLLGGGQLQRDFGDFLSRYEQGHPSEGYSDQEVVQRYSDVAHAVPPDQYAQAAQEALARLSPEERAAFVKMLQERAQAKGVALPGRVGANPQDLGQVVTDLHQTPGRLRDLLSAGDTPTQAAAGPSPLESVLASPLARAALAGITAMVVKRVMRGGAA
jgi:predicted RNA-binding Zn ribbon-like protein